MARKGNYGSSLASVKMTSQAFKQFELTIQLIEQKIQSFISTAEMMVKDDHYDASLIRSEISNLQRKWSSFHTSVGEYRDLLEISINFFQLLDEVYLLIINILGYRKN